MYAPAALAIASDFWRVSAIGAVIAATLDEDDLGVFNASYRIMWMSLTLTGSLGGAIATKLGLRLGRGPCGNQALIWASPKYSRTRLPRAHRYQIGSFF